MHSSSGAATPEIVALVVSPPSEVWGAQLYLFDQVEALAERGVRLELASPAGTPFADEWSARGWPLVDLDVRRHEGLRRAGSDARPGPASLARTAAGVMGNARRIAAVAGGYDMLYSFSLAGHLEVALAGRLARTPVALDLVDIVREGIGRRVLRAAARLADLTVANSSATAEVLAGVGAVRIIHPGIDLERFTPEPPMPDLRRELTGPDDRPLVGVVGRLDATKGVHVLVEAMGGLGGSAADARLVVVGDVGTGPADYAEQLRRDADRILGDRVLFTGRRSDVAEIIRTLDVLVVASVAEPFGLTALEAQASRTPVVGTDSGGLPEFVEHEVTGLLVPPNRPGEMAAAIERMLTDPELREAVVDEAERRARPARGLAAQYDQLAAMYRDVASRQVAS